MPNMTVATLCRKNSTPPVASNWLIGAAPSSGAITSTCNSTPEHADAGDADQRGQQVREVIDREQEEHAVHAQHDQLGVADPHDIDHAEDQVQSERQQCQYAAQQHAVDQRLQQIDVEDVDHHWLVCEVLAGGVTLIVRVLLVLLDLVVDQATGESGSRHRQRRQGRHCRRSRRSRLHQLHRCAVPDSARCSVELMFEQPAKPMQQTSRSAHSGLHRCGPSVHLPRRAREMS